MHTVKATPAADRALRRIGRRNHSAYLRIKAAIDSLAVDPRPPGARKLKGSTPPSWRIRIGEYRVVYRVYDDLLEVLIVDAGHRGKTYRRR